MRVFVFSILILASFNSFTYAQVKDSSAANDSISINKDSVKIKKITPQKKSPPKKVKEESFMDKLQKFFGIRRSFDISSETTKPALLSFKKDNDEATTFNTDIALTYKGFRYDTWGFSPSIQFDYSSKSKDQLEKLKTGFDVYYKLYENDDGSGRIEPAISYAKDFYSKLEEFESGISFVPRFPKFLIPIQNVSDIKFKYDGNDNRWIFGFNPVVGTNFKRTYGGKKHISQTEYLGIVAGSLSLRRYFLLFVIYGRYEDEFRNDTYSKYKYNFSASVYFDEKERSSINAGFEQEEKDRKIKKKFTIGFGIKL
ncbi:MAG: hypothetical protein ABI528_05155 [bacterium]